MKKLITLIALMMTSLTFASTGALESGDMFIETISEGSIISQERLCPEDFTCFVDGTVVVVELPVGGCLDRLGPVTYTADEIDGEIVIKMTAIRIANKMSLAAFCSAMPVERVTLTLINKYGEAKLKLLKSIR